MARFKVGDIIEFNITPNIPSNALIMDVKEATGEHSECYVFIVLETGATKHNKIFYVDRVARWIS